MTRLRDWQERLDALITSCIDVPFTWGHMDCCMFAADAVRAMTGRDPAADVRGSYSSERGAARVLAKLGGIEAIGETRFGAEVPPAFAAVGDVVLIALDRPTLAVCTGSTCHAPAGMGLAAVPMTLASRAWRVD